MISLVMDKIRGYDWDAIYIGKKNIWKLEEVISTWMNDQLWNHEKVLQPLTNYASIKTHGQTIYET